MGFTADELTWYEDGCFIKQPRVEPGHPDITVATAIANPPVSADTVVE